MTLIPKKRQKIKIKCLTKNNKEIFKMKKITILLFACFFSVSFSMGQLVEINTGNINMLNDVDFINDSVGFVVGNNGTILRTIDGGSTWEQKNIPNVYTHIDNIQCIDSKTAYIHTDTYLYKTVDGGDTWEIFFSNQSESNAIRCFYCMPNNQICYVVTYNKLYKTVDSGNTWESIHQNWPYVNRMVFVNDTIGIVSGPLGYIGKTIDGGYTWQQKTSTASEALYNIRVLNDSVYYIDGGNVILKTLDAGETWNNINQKFPYGVKSVVFITEDLGYAVENEHQVCKTIDGGNTWDCCWLDAFSMTLGIDFLDDSLGYITGDVGKLYKTTNGMFCNTVSIENVFDQSNIIMYPNPAANQVTIETTETILNVQCYNLMGQLLFETQDKVLNINDLPQGTYLIKVRTEDGVLSEKLIVQ